MSATPSDFEKNMRKALEEINKNTNEGIFKLTFVPLEPKPSSTGLPLPDQSAFFDEPIQYTKEQEELQRRYKNVQERDKENREHIKYY